MDFFRWLLPQREMWRLCPEFARRALFLDIETTGLSAWGDEVTVIGGFGGGELSLFVRGVNLEQFPAYVRQFPLLVSFNGSQFDVPFLRVHFPEARLDQAHVDLRFVLASLGYRGGLKAVERRLGLAARRRSAGWTVRGRPALAASQARRPCGAGEAAPLQPDGRGQSGRVVGDCRRGEGACGGVSRRVARRGLFVAEVRWRRLAGWIARRIESGRD